MKLFATLLAKLDQTNATSRKVGLLSDYFRAAEPADAAWTLYLMSGRRIKRAAGHRVLRDAAMQYSGLSDWLMAECYQAVGDTSEMLALLLPEPTNPTDIPLHQLVDDYVLPLPQLSESGKIRLLTNAWDMLSGWERFVYHKLIGGSFRIGVARSLVERAVAQAFEIEHAVMTHRLMGQWTPNARDFERLVSGNTTADDIRRPYPFFLAHALQEDVETLGDAGDWHAEWKWDGIRLQAIVRGDDRDAVTLWTRGDESVAQSFSEIALACRQLPRGTVIDGELLAWDAKADRPLPFADLQTRLNRKDVQPTLFEVLTPIILMAYDLLEADGEDWRERPLETRRAKLAEILAAAESEHIRLSPAIEFAEWGELAPLREQSRERGVEGIMLKRRESPYGVGRPRGDWWKWKVDPYTVDAVLIYAERGHGVRAGLFSDYTFGVWNGDKLVPVAKAYSGLSKNELSRVDAWIRKNTLNRHGPVHVVEPQLVFELAFERIAESNRHRGGLALRFPRMARWRQDKAPADADSIEVLRDLLASA